MTFASLKLLTCANSTTMPSKAALSSGVMKPFGTHKKSFYRAARALESLGKVVL
jgi:hypothetical protein